MALLAGVTADVYVTQVPFTAAFADNERSVFIAAKHAARSREQKEEN